MPHSPAFQFYPADYLGDKNTFPMTTLDHGAYCLLMWFSWEENGLPDDMQELADMAKMPVDDFTTAWDRRIKKCFVWDEKKKRWFHPRLLKEIKKQKAWSKKKSEDGKRGAAKRWNKKSNGDGIPLGDHCGRIAADSSPSSSLSMFKSASEQFVESLKTNPEYSHINVDVELARAEAWANDRNKRFSKRFITNWFNRIEVPIVIPTTNGNGAKPSWQIDIENCSLCDERGYRDIDGELKTCKHG